MGCSAPGLPGRSLLVLSEPTTDKREGRIERSALFFWPVSFVVLPSGSEYCGLVETHMRRGLAIATLCNVVSGGCATTSIATGPPTIQEIEQLEEWRVLEPLASLTLDGRRYVEFAPRIETRNVACAPDQSAFLCSYESRETPFIERAPGPWVARQMTVARGSDGRCFIVKAS